jgi:hypothetical protein
MFTRRVSAVILRPVEDVFAFVEDARNRPRWDDSVDSEGLSSPEPIGVGTTVRTTLRSMGREYVYTWEVVEHRPPSRMTIETISGPFPTTLSYELGEREGATAVAFSVSGRPSGLLRLFEPLIARNTHKNLDRGLSRPVESWAALAGRKPVHPGSGVTCGRAGSRDVSVGSRCAPWGRARRV